MALASKTLDVSTRAQIVLADREKIENDLTFNGFLVTGSLLKDDAVEVVQELIQSSHYVTMITGDALLTAIHVAKVTNIIQGRDPRTVWTQSIRDFQKSPYQLVGPENP